MKSSVLFWLVSGLVLSTFSSPIGAAEEEAREQPPFAEHWQIIAILGKTVQIRDYLGAMHYKMEGESLEGVDIVEVDRESGSILLRNTADGREKRLPESDPRQAKGVPDGGSIIDGKIQGLDTQLNEISFERRRLKEILNLLSKATNQSFITTAAVPDVPFTGKLSNVTMRQLLDTLLGGYGLAWKEPEKGNFIKIMTAEEKAKEDQWVWEMVECEVLAPPMVVQKSLHLLEPGERLEANTEKHGVAILAVPARRAVLKTEIRHLEEKTRAWLEDQSGGISEGVPGLKSQVPLCEIDNRPLCEVMNLLARFSDLNYIVHPTVRGIPVTAKLQNVTVRDILDTMLPPYGCRWEPTGNLKSIRVLPAAQPIVGKRSDRGSFFDRFQRTSPPYIEAATQEITALLPELKTVILDLNLESQRLAETLNLLSRESGLNFSTQGFIPKRTISAGIHGLTVREVLDALLPEYGCRWDILSEGPSILVTGCREGPPRVLPAK